MVVVVKWSTCSPSSLTILVQILLNLRFYSVKLVERTKKRPGMAKKRKTEGHILLPTPLPPRSPSTTPTPTTSTTCTCTISIQCHIDTLRGFCSVLLLVIGNINFSKNIFDCGKSTNDVSNSVTRLGNLVDFGQLFKAFGNK